MGKPPGGGWPAEWPGKGMIDGVDAGGTGRRRAGGVNAMLRKVAVAAASKPHVEIRQDGDQFYIKTSTTVRTTEINFKVGESFEEETVDGRKCRSLATWENENKIYCKQTLLEGEGPKTYWTRELAGEELILTFGANDVVCTRIYVRE
ncbi:cellular retinoic acid-binding protein 1 isoform X2 [Sphaerodactylus townsendi]|uniref:cellular retinoic acid-binding protein 1 isoform X2 n=1 Tax=Sphaerodactylus townsendi TaxID=933632 RepID=UPI0020270039|nr:cellular retinoic acid-binding protein 1 isoform X2 [Sphaerodactylus townsendi]